MNGELYGRDSKMISVIPYNKEFLSIYQDTLFLKQIAARNNGRFFNAQNMDSIFAYMDLKPENVKKSSRVFLYFEPIILFLILGFFILEWIIRKRNNLA